MYVIKCTFNNYNEYSNRKITTIGVRPIFLGGGADQLCPKSQKVFRQRPKNLSKQHAVDELKVDNVDNRLPVIVFH